MDDHTKDSKKSSNILVLITRQWNIGAWVHSWHSYDILGARMLWKPKEARILKNFIKF
jgi:hypothetical protein